MHDNKWVIEEWIEIKYPRVHESSEMHITNSIVTTERILILEVHNFQTRRENRNKKIIKRSQKRTERNIQQIRTNRTYIVWW